MKEISIKGFTLIELLAVIIVLGIIVTIGGISVASVISSAREKTYAQQVVNIEKAAKEWALENTEKLPETETRPTYVTLEVLKDTGKLTDYPTSPKNGEIMSGYVKISCTANCVSYTYKYYR